MKGWKRKLLCVAALSLAGVFLLLAAVSTTGQLFEDTIVGATAPVALLAGQQTDPWNGTVPGRATYVGVDDMDTFFSQQVLDQTRRWSNTLTPFDQGYGGLCEAWVYDVYTAAGLPCRGSCCAWQHGQVTANRTGPIPKGALIFSGVIPSTGQLYENDHRESAYCHVCGHFAGHVAIYVGNGMVAGAQLPYLQSLDAWIEVYGYGGWSTY